MNASAPGSNKHSPAVVLLATCDGASWLPQLLDSVLAQDHPKLQILARDDCSEDATLDVLASYQQAAPGRISLLDNPGRERVGPRANFAALAEAALAAPGATPDSLYLFCDQDDLWHPGKVATLARHLPAVAAGEPALCYCDMRVVDAGQELLADSFLEYQALPGTTQLPQLLVQNHISGCASLFNRAALELATPIADKALMHDWWLALLVAAAGEVSFCDEVLLDYRQHDKNSVGASGYSMGYVMRRSLDPDRVTLAKLYQQADALQQRLAEQGLELPASLVDFAETRLMSLPGRALRLWQAGFRKRGWLRNLPLLFSPAAERENQ
ncbi:MAG: glycosyltransferase [Halieaceae bacterium]